MKCKKLENSFKTSGVTQNTEKLQYLEEANGKVERRVHKLLPHGRESEKREDKEALQLAHD